MSELEKIAASVAKALGLVESVSGDCWAALSYPDPDDKSWLYLEHLMKDGSNIYSPYWQCRCRDWLLESGHAISMGWTNEHFIAWWESAGVSKKKTIECPASEFAARAIQSSELPEELNK
jgi:hypothetical protein